MGYQRDTGNRGSPQNNAKNPVLLKLQSLMMPGEEGLKGCVDEVIVI
jgi:hypothetical protein